MVGQIGQQEDGRAVVIGCCRRHGGVGTTTRLSHHRRQAASYLFDKKTVKKLFDDLAPRMKDRPGGYLRIIKRGVRFGDGAKLATIEFVDYEPGKS